MKNYISASVLGLGLAATAQAQEEQNPVVGEKYVFENCSAPAGKPSLTMGDVRGVTTQLNVQLLTAATVSEDWYRNVKRQAIAQQRQALASFVQNTRAGIDQFVGKLDAVPARNDAETSQLLDALIKEITQMLVVYAKSPYVTGSPDLPNLKDVRVSKVKGELPAILTTLDVECKGLDDKIATWFNPPLDDSYYGYGYGYGSANTLTDYGEMSSRPVGNYWPTSGSQEETSALEKFQTARESVEIFRKRLTETESKYVRELDGLAAEVDPKVEEPVPPPKGKKGGKK